MLIFIRHPLTSYVGLLELVCCTVKKNGLKNFPPYQGGGEMISEVTFENTTYAELPNKFEAGTPNIVGAIGFGFALDYLNEIGFDDIESYENELLEYATSKLKQVPDLKIYGQAEKKTSVISFNVGSIHSYDIGTILRQIRNCCKDWSALRTACNGLFWNFRNSQSLLHFTTQKRN